MDLEGKVDEMRGMLHEMKPVLSGAADSLKSLDARTRSLEIKDAEHDVKISRVQSDLDGLGRKLRDRQVHVRQAGDGGRFLAFLEVIAALPKYWHVLFTLGSIATTAFVVLVKHWPH